MALYKICIFSVILVRQISLFKIIRAFSIIFPKILDEIKYFSKVRISSLNHIFKYENVMFLICMKYSLTWGRKCEKFNLRSSPILAVLIRLPLKLGLIQTLSRLCSLRPDFGRNADWLLEQCRKIWLAVGNARS